jgi:outer membrane protein assembly factor BamB
LPYLVLEFIDGPSLREVLDREPLLPPARVLGLGAALARGLVAIHGVEGVHRDLKPTNIRLRGGREPVIVDLGMTRAFWETQDATRPGLAAMTPRYASPEQLAGREVGPASDIYSLGLILCELLTGEAPAVGQGPREMLEARRGRVPRALLEWVPRCLERDPARRPAALELALALEEAAVRTAPAASPGRSPVLRWGAVIGAALLLALGAAMVSRPRGTAPVGSATEAPLEGEVPPWSLRWGDAAGQTLLSLALDARGHVFVAGHLRGSVDVGTGPLTSAGSNDVLVARLDPGGRALWGRRFGDAGLQNVNAIAADPAGHVFLIGGFTGSLDFDGQRLFNPGDQDIFLARLDSEGRTLWSQRFGDLSEQVGDLVAVDPKGNAVLAGHFHGALDLGGGALVSEGLADVFLARFTPEGQHLWSRRFGNVQSQGPTGLAVDRAGRIALTGLFEESIDFGEGALSSPDSQGSFVALFDAQGQHLWSRRLGDALESHGGPATFDSEGHLVVVENFSRATTQGISLTRFTPQGQLLWSRRFEGLRVQGAQGIAAAPEGRIVVTGAVQGTLELGDGPFSVPGGMDVFVLELGLDGDVLGIRRFGDASPQAGRSVAVDARGDVMVSGSFEGRLDFDSGPLVSAGASDFFLARLTPSRVPPPLAKGGACLPPFPGQRAWYSFEEPTPEGEMGPSPPGRLLGAASVAPDRAGGALLLEGGFFEVPDAEALDFGQGPFSLSAWLRTTRAKGTQVILDKRREPPGESLTGYYLFVTRGLLGLQLSDGIGSAECEMTRFASCTTYRSGRFVADGAWHLVTVTVARDTPFGGTFYVDGEVVSRFDPTVKTGSLDNEYPLRIGSRSSSETGLFHGLIDEVALWNRALSSEEVSRLYQAGRTGPCRAQSSGPPRSP